MHRRVAGASFDTPASPKLREENGLSRILVGFHFRDAVETGIKHGEKIGERAVNLYLRPAP